MTSVVVVDDHPVFRFGLAGLLREEGIEVRAEVGTAAEVLEAVARTGPDVAIIDLHLPDASGVEVTRRIVADHPATRVLVLTMDGADGSTVAALRAGARGYLLKETAAESIASTVTAIVRGELVLDRRLAGRLAGMLQAVASAPPGLEGLTGRELEVLGLVAKGLSNREIGRTLFLADKTVRNNVSTLLAKTGAPTRAALIALARDRDVGSP